jgi:ABC-type multidrug transport system ATPase subunit
MIPASAKFYDGVSVESAIRLYLSLRGVAVRGDIFESFDPFSLRDHGAVAFGDLSLGWKKRLMLHMAFACDPDVLFLDEPTIGLDMDGIKRLIRLMLHRECRGITVVTCHEPSAMMTLSLTRYMLQAGIHGSVLNLRDESRDRCRAGASMQRDPASQ